MRKRLSPAALRIQSKVQATIRDYALLPDGANPLVALSGGVDSMVLLSMLIRWERWPIAIAHCNFHLRGEESNRDEEFTRQYVLSQGIEQAHFTDFNTELYARSQSISIELAARRLRYRWFASLRNQHGYTHIVTAHHANDQAETLLLNLARGAGLRGMGGIPPRNGAVVRPLLGITREEILLWARELNVPWREDSTNQAPIYARNLVRLEVIPRLEQLHPGAPARMAKTALLMRRMESTLNHEAILLFGRYPSGSLVQRSGYTLHTRNAMQGEHRELFLLWLRGLILTLGFTSSQAEDLEQALMAKKGGVNLISGAIRCQFRQGILKFQPVPDAEH